MELTIFLIALLVLLVHAVILQFNIWTKRQSHDRIAIAVLSSVSNAIQQLSNWMKLVRDNQSVQGVRGERSPAGNEPKSQPNEESHLR